MMRLSDCIWLHANFVPVTRQNLQQLPAHLNTYVWTLVQTVQCAHAFLTVVIGGLVINHIALAQLYIIENTRVLAL